MLHTKRCRNLVKVLIANTLLFELVSVTDLRIAYAVCSINITQACNIDMNSSGMK